jgi:hypothetical protein
MEIKSLIRRVILAVSIMILVHIAPIGVALLMGKGSISYPFSSFIEKISLIKSGCFIDSKCFGSAQDLVCTDGGAWVCEPRLESGFWGKALIYLIIYFIVITIVYMIIKRCKKSSTTSNSV